MTLPATTRTSTALVEAAAARLMREGHIRHLPVAAGGQVVGMLSERDLLGEYAP